MRWRLVGSCVLLFIQWKLNWIVVFIDWTHTCSMCKWFTFVIIIWVTYTHRDKQQYQNSMIQSALDIKITCSISSRSILYCNDNWIQLQCKCKCKWKPSKSNIQFWPGKLLTHITKSRAIEKNPNKRIQFSIASRRNGYIDFLRFHFYPLWKLFNSVPFEELIDGADLIRSRIAISKLLSSHWSSTIARAYADSSSFRLWQV